LAEYRDRLPEIEAADASVVALSVDGPERSEAVRRRLSLPFSILCDTSRRVLERWHLLNRGEKGGIAYPAVFVVDRDRRIRYRSLDRTAQRVSTGDVLRFLRGAPAEAEPRRRVVLPRLREWRVAIGNALRGGIRSRST
jgi:peroxiredoxin